MYLVCFTVFNVFLVITSYGFGKYDRFTKPNNKHITTDVMHCIHVTNSGASNSTVSLLKSALFTKTVTIEIVLFENGEE